MLRNRNLWYPAHTHGSLLHLRGAAARAALERFKGAAPYPGADDGGGAMRHWEGEASLPIDPGTPAQDLVRGRPEASSVTTGTSCGPSPDAWWQREVPPPATGQARALVVTRAGAAARLCADLTKEEPDPWMAGGRWRGGVAAVAGAQLGRRSSPVAARAGGVGWGQRRRGGTAESSLGVAFLVSARGLRERLGFPPQVVFPSSAYLLSLRRFRLTPTGASSPPCPRSRFDRAC